NDYLHIILLVIAVVMILFIVLMINLFVRLSSLKRNYMKIINGTKVENLEGIIIKIHEEIKQLKSNQTKHNDWLQELQNTIKKMKSNIGFLRYNASEERGNDLSFSLAIVDEDRNGVVLTGLYSRDQTYVYAKPLSLGDSNYTLTTEEK